MQFRFISSDGLIQKGLLVSDQITIQTPNIIYTNINKRLIPDQEILLLTDLSQDVFSPIYEISLQYKKENKKNTPFFKIESPLFYPSILSPKTDENINDSYPMYKKNVYVASECIPNNLSMLSQHIQLFIISHSLQMYNNPKDIAFFFQQLRASISPDQLVYMPADATPQNLAVLLYLGVDLVDSTQAIIAARNNMLHFSTGVLDISRLKTIPCHCPICQKHHGNPSLYRFHDILFHNYFMLNQEMNMIYHAIEQETIREHVNIRISNHPHLTSVIQFFERDPYHVLEHITPRYKPSLIQATGINDLQRPEIKRFQRQVVTTYTKPKHAQILLLLPCSAKKPYSFSKSHKTFLRAIQSIPNHHCIHELIITSPLGIVPRELELMYPASSYDIPVTGNWFEDEKQMINNLLEQYLARNQYKKIIVHLSDPMKTVLKNNFQSMISTDTTTPLTTKESIDKLMTILRNETVNAKQVSPSIRLKDNMYSVATFQFSQDIANDLLQNTVIKGKYPFLKIFDSNHNQLGMLTEPRGMISLTLDGADRIQSHHTFYVILSNDFTLKGSVFAPGVVDADSGIRKGDEVLVFQNNRLQAVGVAQMSGVEMVQRMSGKAVDVRHSK